MKVSILLPSFNYEVHIQEAIDSVLGQTYGDWELIIIDDGSADGSYGLAERYAKEYPDRIKLVTHAGRKNKGLEETYLLGIQKASGKYICFIEADDRWHPENIGRKVAILEREKEVVVVSDRPEMFGDPFLVRAQKVKFTWKNFPNNEVSNRSFYAFKYLMRYNFVQTFSAFMVRREAFEGIDFSPRHSAWLDWWLLSQLSVRGKFFYIPESYVYWRVHDRNYNKTYSESIDEYREGIRFRDDIFSWMKDFAKKTDLEVHEPLKAALENEKKRRQREWLELAVKGTLKKVLPKSVVQAIRKSRIAGG